MDRMKRMMDRRDETAWDGKPALSGMVQGMFMMAFFTVFWAAFMFWSFMNGGFAAAVGVEVPAAVTSLPVAQAMFTVFAIFAAIFVYNGVTLRRPVKALSGRDKTAGEKRTEKLWSLIFGLQGAAIGGVCSVLWMTGHPELILPAIVLIVGIHYFPLGALYHSRIYGIVATPVTSVAALSILSVLNGGDAGLISGICAVTAAVSTTIFGCYLAWRVRLSIYSPGKPGLQRQILSPASPNARGKAGRLRRSSCIMKKNIDEKEASCASK